MSSDETTDEVQPFKTTAPVVPPTPPERRAPSDQQTEIRKELGDFERISIRIQRRVLYATWAIAAITGIYVFVTYRQWRTMQSQLGVMNNQLADARKSAKDADKITGRQMKLAESQGVSLGKQADALGNLVVATTSAAGAAQTSAKNSDRIAHGSEAAVKATKASMRLDQRAWVGIGNVTGTPQVGEPFKVVVALHNSGRTPAKITESMGASDPVLKGGKPDLTYTDLQHTRGAFIPPNGDFHFSVVVTRSRSTGKVAVLTKELLEAVNTGLMQVFVHGEIRYVDIFAQEHCLRYCFFYNPDEPSWGACEEHNDDQCGGKK